jgi:Alcohol dehydrogenase GroES-associated
MRALVWHGKRDVRCDTVPDPPCGSALQRSFLSAKAATGESLVRNKDGDMNHNNIRGAKKAYK